MALALVAPTAGLMRLRGGGAMPRNIENSLIKDDLAALQKALEQGTLDGESVTKEGNSAMHLVCRHGARSCLDALLEAGVGDVDARRPSDGGTPLMYASQNGHLPCAERLLRAGASGRRPICPLKGVFLRWGGSGDGGGGSGSRGGGSGERARCT